MFGGAPWEPTFVFARAVLSPVHPESFEAHELWALALAATLLLLLATKVFKEVGLTPVETTSLLVLAPMVAHVEAPLWVVAPNATLAMNAAGFFIPVIVSIKLIVEGRAPFLVTLFALGVATGVSYMSSYAVPHEGVLLYYRIPALVAGGLALLLARGVWHRVGPIAYVAGAGGVIVGADALRIHELLVTPDPHRIIVGGAGVMDGIFLVGILAVLLGAFGVACVNRTRAVLAPTSGVRAPGGEIVAPSGGARRREAGDAE